MGCFGIGMARLCFKLDLSAADATIGWIFACLITRAKLTRCDECAVVGFFPRVICPLGAVWPAPLDGSLGCGRLLQTGAEGCVWATRLQPSADFWGCTCQVPSPGAAAVPGWPQPCRRHPGAGSCAASRVRHGGAFCQCHHVDTLRQARWVHSSKTVFILFESHLGTWWRFLAFRSTSKC